MRMPKATTPTKGSHHRMPRKGPLILVGTQKAQGHEAEVQQKVYPQGVVAHDDVDQIAHRQHGPAHEAQHQAPPLQRAGAVPGEHQGRGQIGPVQNFHVLPNALPQGRDHGGHPVWPPSIQKMEHYSQKCRAKKPRQQPSFSIYHRAHLPNLFYAQRSVPIPGDTGPGSWTD